MLPAPSVLLHQFPAVVVPASLSLSEQHDERPTASDARQCSLGALSPNKLALSPVWEPAAWLGNICQSPELQILTLKATLGLYMWSRRTLENSAHRWVRYDGQEGKVMYMPRKGKTNKHLSLGIHSMDLPHFPDSLPPTFQRQLGTSCLWNT